MNREDMKSVKQYLYSIKRTELSIINLEKAIEELDTRRQSPPVWMHNPDAIAVCGGNIEESKQEVWVQFLEAYPARRSYLLDILKQHQNKVEQFYQALDAMAKTERWGTMGVNIIRHKYIQRISPDAAIYTMFLYCSERAYYQTHRRALQFFFDVLPAQFQ